MAGSIAADTSEISLFDQFRNLTGCPVPILIPSYRGWNISIDFSSWKPNWELAMEKLQAASDAGDERAVVLLSGNDDERAVLGALENLTRVMEENGDDVAGKILVGQVLRGDRRRSAYDSISRVIIMLGKIHEYKDRVDGASRLATFVDLVNFAREQYVEQKEAGKTPTMHG